MDFAPNIRCQAFQISISYSDCDITVAEREIKGLKQNFVTYDLFVTLIQKNAIQGQNEPILGMKPYIPQFIHEDMLHDYYFRDVLDSKF